MANNCTGKTSGTSTISYGVNCVSGTATGCQGIGGGGSSTSLRAVIAIGCITTNGTPNIMNKYNMP